MGVGSLKRPPRAAHGRALPSLTLGPSRLRRLVGIAVTITGGAGRYPRTVSGLRAFGASACASAPG